MTEPKGNTEFTKEEMLKRYNRETAWKTSLSIASVLAAPITIPGKLLLNIGKTGINSATNFNNSLSDAQNFLTNNKLSDPDKFDVFWGRMFDEQNTNTKYFKDVTPGQKNSLKNYFDNPDKIQVKKLFLVNSMKKIPLDENLTKIFIAELFIKINELSSDPNANKSDIDTYEKCASILLNDAKPRKSKILEYYKNNGYVIISTVTDNIEKHDFLRFAEYIVNNSETTNASLPPSLTIDSQITDRSKNLNFLSAEYDNFFREVEVTNSMLTFSSVFGLASPVVSEVIAIFRLFVLIGVKETKYKELIYICSACLGFACTNINNILEMSKFYAAIANHSYGEEKAKVSKYKPSPTWNGNMGVLLKFLHFLVSQLDFTEKELGPAQFVFWLGFLNLCNFDDRIKLNKMFEYDDNACVYVQHRGNYYGKVSNIDRDGILQSTNTDLNRKCNTYKYLILRVLESKVIDLIHKVNKAENKGGFTKAEQGYLKYNEFKFLLHQIQAIPRISQTIRFGGGLKKHRTVANKQIMRYSKTSKKRFNANFTQKYTGGGIITWLNKGKDAEQKYREMLREYVISTGNMSLILGEYLIHYNEYNRLFPEGHKHSIRIVMDNYEKTLITHLVTLNFSKNVVSSVVQGVLSFININNNKDNEFVTSGEITQPSTPGSTPGSTPESDHDTDNT
jgi:hypothetical protein